MRLDSLSLSRTPATLRRFLSYARYPGVFEIGGKIDTMCNSFWTGGISNPLKVIEQITYLLFLRRLDDFHTAEELKATRLNPPMFPKEGTRRIFPEGVENSFCRGVALPATSTNSCNLSSPT
jgi:hypothetical protein